ncbi:DNA mismatch repair protein Msh6-like [Watersipora subatra]|uniref:DNA mismatch repair protein Msh6-like n=1 Tax=Watersipora subatra TaxID=2589382 RepID=UPI00355B78F1
MSQKSLFAYFTSPKTPAGKAVKESNGTPASTPKQGKRSSTATPPSAKENRKPKRRRVILSDSEDEPETAADRSGEEYEPSDQMDSNSDTEEQETLTRKAKSNNDTSKSSSHVPSMSSTPKLSKFTASADPIANVSSSSRQSCSANTVSKLGSFSAPPEASEAEGVYLHQTLEFLKPDKIKDKEKRLESDPDYDPRTLYVPKDFLNSTTPAMRQWWKLKEDYFDTILFFKMGKFYEFFHMDADVGVKELGLVYMKGNYAHSGFPEIGYGRYADTLLRKGYKIARIEQTETPDMMASRLDQSISKVTKFDKVVKREVCQITTPGTRTPNFLDGETIDSSSNYLLAICEIPGIRSSQIGVCFLDTSTSRFHVGQFEEDIYGSRLRTLTAHFNPGQVLYEKRKTSALLAHLFKTNLSSVLKEALVPNSEFWGCEKTIRFLSEGDYFQLDDGSHTMDWPEALKAMLDNSDAVCKKAKEGYELALRSLGAIIWYLRSCFLDQAMLSLRLFTEYVPLDHKPIDTLIDNSRMVMDSVTLANLDVLVNQSTGTIEGTLLERLDRCKTVGGRRLLREWISAPLCDHRLINDRLDAISNLMEIGDLSQLEGLMKRLPDFERLLSKVHTLGHAKHNKNHPDSRAIMFESEIYNKRKIDSFLSLLEGFKTAVGVVELFKSVNIVSTLLRKCVNFKDGGGRLADIRPQLKYFRGAFDHEAARKAGAIHPAKGYVEEYDESVEEIKSIDSRLTEYLKSQRKLLSSQSVTYVGTGRNRYQLEVPDTVAKRVPGHYEVTGQKKGHKRYVTMETKSLLSELMDAEEKQISGLKDTMRKIFKKFDESFTEWMTVVECMNVLDVLLSLTAYSMTSEGVMSRPELVPTSSGRPFIEIKEGRHPNTVKTFGGSSFIPNDTVIGLSESGKQEEAELLLLTGPNMGGKSTLMRQVGLLTVLSQLGSYVPAEKCRLTPVDRIFTRLGASDCLLRGESTFFVELSETNIILQHATHRSLVLLDELGRGTATHDGTAIASAVLYQLIQVQCRTIFSTHYHSLVDDFKDDQRVQMGHMACLVDEDESSPDGTQSITFLYKLAPDFCPKSYGFNVARLAGLPTKLIELGLAKAESLERSMESRKLLRSLLLAKRNGKMEELRALIQAA